MVIERGFILNCKCRNCGKTKQKKYQPIKLNFNNAETESDITDEEMIYKLNHIGLHRAADFHRCKDGKFGVMEVKSIEEDMND